MGLVVAGAATLWDKELAWAEEDAGVVVRPIEVWRGVFADRRMTFHFSVTSQAPVQGSLVWSLSANRRTLARGAVAIEVAPGQPVQAAVPINAPHVKAGVALPAQFAASFVGDDERAGAGVRGDIQYEQTIWIFSPDAFVHRARWLEQLDIALFDPKEKTADVFDDAAIPYRAVRSTASLAELDAGMLLIGEGVSLDDYPRLGDVILQRAAAGMPVLCLAPADGRIPVPTGELKNELRPRSVSFRGGDVVGQLDKRLDAGRWPGGGSVRRSFRLMLNRDRLVAESAPPGEGWPWIEIEFSEPPGRLVLCGFAVIERWEDGPVPRYLLARMLERLSGHEVALTARTDP